MTSQTPQEQPGTDAVLELRFARDLEGELLEAARQRTTATPAPAAGRRSRRQRPSAFLRRTMTVAATLVGLAALPVLTSLVLSLVDDDGIPRATADLPVSSGDIEVVPMGQANAHFDVDLTTVAAIAQSVEVVEPTRVSAAEVDLHPPTVLEMDGSERFAAQGPPLQGSVTVSVWQAGDHVDLDEAVELRADFRRVAHGVLEGDLPRNDLVRVPMDPPVVLPGGRYLVVVGFEFAPDQRIVRMGVSGAIEGSDQRGQLYPDGQAFQAVERGSDQLWFEPYEAPGQEDGLPQRGDLQLWLRAR